MNTQLEGPKHVRADAGRAHRGRSLLAAAAASLVALAGLSGVALADDPQNGAQSGVDNSAVGVDATSNRTSEGEGSGSESPDGEVQSAEPSSATGSLATGSSTQRTAEQSVSAQRAQSGIFTCQAGYIYSMQSNGSILQIAPNGVTSTVYTASGSTSGSSMNGLGIGAEGATAYWYERTTDSANSLKFLVKYENTTAEQVSNSSNSSMGSNSLVAGAVDPTTGTFLIGKIANQEIRLWAWTGSGYKALGTATNSKLPKESLNGDMAFDAAGNLYVVSSTDPPTDWWGNVTGPAKVNITLVKASDIAAAIAANNSTHQTPASNVSSKKISADSGFNGIAFDSDGYVYVGNSTKLLKYDPTSWDLLATVTSSLSTSTDLSSCSTPPTLEVRKNLPQGRVTQGDQFTLNIADSTGATTTTATTTGDAAGIQAVTAGPSPVVAGKQYTVSEAKGTDSTDLSNYASSLVCVDTANGDASIPVTNGRLTIPKGSGKAARVTCTFTNTPNLGAATWSKVAADGATVLGGSTWKLTGPGNSAELEVVDNVGQTGYSGADRDDRPGQFKIEGLRVGSYSLVETSAPEGYVVDPTSHKFDVKPGGQSVSVGSIKNTPIKGSVEWLKVGPDGQTALGGSEWTLTPTDPSGQSQAVVDNTGQSGYTGLDKDPAAGKFRVENLTYGKYQIVESKAPAGYVLDPTAHGFSITEDGKSVTVGGSPFKNTPIKGSVEWLKVGPDGQTALGGSEWTLTPTDPSGQSQAVVDNTGQSGYTGLDKDPAAGKFRVENLTYGKYQIVESKAPAGYVLDPTAHGFSITEDGKSVTVAGSPFKNQQAVPPSLPLTGGLGTDTFLLAGGGLLALAGIGGWIHRRRSQRLRMA